MRCPYCGCQEDRVLESRSVREGAAIRRRRECAACERRYTTFEQIEVRPLAVVKKDGRRELFEREKLRRSILIACQKRPVPSEVIEAVVDGIEQDFSDRPAGEVRTGEIGERVVEALRRVDQVAYVRFASVYRDFQDIDQFKEVVEVLSHELKRQAHDDNPANHGSTGETEAPPASAPGDR
jgi:transcriptional repressor NrdR